MLSRLARGPTFAFAIVATFVVGFAVALGAVVLPGSLALPMPSVVTTTVHSVSPMTEISGVLLSLSFGSQMIEVTAIAGALTLVSFGAVIAAFAAFKEEEDAPRRVMRALHSQAFGLPPAPR